MNRIEEAGKDGKMHTMKLGWRAEEMEGGMQASVCGKGKPHPRNGR